MNLGIQAIVSVFAVVFLTACNRSGYTGSGLPESLTDEALVERLGASQGVRIFDRDGGVGKDLHSHEVHSQYSVALTSGTAAQLLTSLREEMQQMILDSGETLYGSETVVPAGLRDFAFHYASADHKGVLRVYTAETSTNTFRLIMFCYEHRTDGPPFEP